MTGADLDLQIAFHGCLFFQGWQFATCSGHTCNVCIAGNMMHARISAPPSCCSRTRPSFMGSGPIPSVGIETQNVMEAWELRRHGDRLGNMLEQSERAPVGLSLPLSLSLSSLSSRSLYSRSLYIPLSLLSFFLFSLSLSLFFLLSLSLSLLSLYLYIYMYIYIYLSLSLSLSLSRSLALSLSLSSLSLFLSLSLSLMTSRWVFVLFSNILVFSPWILLILLPRKSQKHIGSWAVLSTASCKASSTTKSLGKTTYRTLQFDSVALLEQHAACCHAVASQSMKRGS